MVLERCTILLAGPDDQGIGIKLAISVFKAIKEKLLVIMQNDTVDKNRDQAAILVSMLLFQAS